MHAEGVNFHNQTHVGVDFPVSRLLEDFDALVLAGGSEEPRDLKVPGRELAGIHFAMELLPQQNRRVAGDRVEGMTAAGKHVVVIGGGDTGSDCIGTSVRQGARSVTQIEILPRPPERENKPLTWPDWPNKLRTSSSHEEGARREWSVSTRAFHGQDGRVTGITLVRVDWQKDAAGNWKMSEVAGSEIELKADLVLLAMGFVHPVHRGLLQELGVELDGRGNVKADTQRYQTSLPRIFTAGDMRRGQSLVVWAIREGRQCARAVDEYLMGRSDLPR
jgi:glutamate synthase (NADPH/NADH) small chain